MISQSKLAEMKGEVRAGTMSLSAYYATIEKTGGVEPT
jgi:hypothetical protein